MNIIVVTNTNILVVYVFTEIYIPPNRVQAFNQGGTFIFANEMSQLVLIQSLTMCKGYSVQKFTQLNNDVFDNISYLYPEIFSIIYQ